MTNTPLPLNSFLKAKVNPYSEEGKESKENYLLLFNLKNEIYTTSAFCGYCLSDLSKGALIGNKIVCRECGSGFCVSNGFVEDGPSLRHLLKFPTDKNESGISVMIPTE